MVKIITKVVLKNWKSHLKSELEFTKGTNILLGHLGSGKSSVLDAICFGLFGTFPFLHSKKIKLDDVIMRKPIEKDKAEVEVYFEVDGKKYSVKRVIERGKGTTYSEFREDGKLTEAPNSTRVTELVEKVLKVDYELFFKAIYSEQNQLDFFLTIPRGKRMKKIDELLMIDKFEKVRANLVTVKNRLLERKSTKEDVLRSLNLEEIRKELDKIENLLVTSEREESRLRVELQDVIRKKDEVEKEILSLKMYKEMVDKLRREESSLLSAIQEVKLSLQEIKKRVRGLDEDIVRNNIEENEKKINELEDEIKKSKKSYEELLEKSSALSTKLDLLKKRRKELEIDVLEGRKLRERLKEIEKEFGDAEEKLKKKREEQINIERTIQNLQTRIELIKDVLQKLIKSKGNCPVCKSELSDERREKLIEEDKNEMRDLSQQLRATQEKREKLEEELKKLERINEEVRKIKLKIESLDEIESEMKRLEEELNKGKKELDVLKPSITDLQNKIEALEGELKITRKKHEELKFILSDFERLKEKTKRLEDMEKKLEDVKRKIKEVEERLEGKDIEKLEIFLNELTGKEKEIETRIKGIVELKAERKKRFEDLKEKLEIYEKEEREIKKLEKILRDIRVFEKALEETQTQLRKQFIVTVNATMSQIWETLYPYKDFVGIRLNIEGGDYILQLQERSGRYISVEGIASGGERSIACLALRVAFSLVLAPHLRILVLDEPTHNLDRKAIEDFSRTLRERINEFVDQVFIITHTPEIEDAITGYAYRLERDKSKDEPTKVIRII